MRRLRPIRIGRSSIRAIPKIAVENFSKRVHLTRRKPALCHPDVRCLSLVVQRLPADKAIKSRQLKRDAPTRLVRHHDFAKGACLGRTPPGSDLYEMKPSRNAQQTACNEREEGRWDP